MTAEAASYEPAVEAGVTDPRVAEAYNILGSEEALVDAVRERNQAEAVFRQNSDGPPSNTDDVHPAIRQAWDLITGRYNGPSN